MGSGRFDHHAYTSYSSGLHGKSTDQVFGSRGIKKELDPLGVKIRESRDSADNPQSSALIVGLDVTGSMGMVADAIARDGLGVLFNRLLDEKPISDPHLMFMGIGDANYDRAPLQVSQFEADNRIVEQLAGLWLEHGGGGNASESYHLPWYFAALHTSIDCFEKRGKKGYLFTVGDEETPGKLLRSQITAVIGDTPQKDYTAEELLAMAEKSYNVFHIIIGEGSHARSRPDQVRDSWSALMGERALWLKDHTKLADGIVSIIDMNESLMGHGTSTTVKELPGYVAMLR